MGSWLFKSLLVKPDGAPELVELNLAQLRRIPLYAEALRVAADSLFQNRLFPVTSCARYWNGWARAGRQYRVWPVPGPAWRRVGGRGLA